MSYIVNKPEYFNLEQIADSGQCFRFKKVSNNKYRTIYREHYLEIEETDKELIVSCDKSTWEDIWIRYFDLDTDYSEYAQTIRGLNDDYKYVKEAFEYSKGIRLLKQDTFEMIISYIISQRNRIPKISACVEKLSEEFGKKLIDKHTEKTYYSFPTVDELPTKISEYADIKLGYRDVYIANAVIDIKRNGLDYYNTFEKVKELYGVGDKVANCYLLFGKHDISRFPVDVWIQRILNREFDGYMNIEPFKEFAGIVQQYMFYFERTQTNH